MEVLESLFKHARFLRSSAKDPRRSKAAADWEIFFEERLKEATEAPSEPEAPYCVPVAETP